MTARDIRVQLLCFEGCPLAPAARRNLELALADLGLERYEAVDLLDPATPEPLRAWGSPTILVDGADVAGHEQGDGATCRLYAGRDRVPSRMRIAERIRQALEKGR